MKDEQVPAWVETIAPKTAEEIERAQRHARDFRLRLEIFNGTRIVTENQPPVSSTIISTNSARLHEDYVIGGVA